MKSEVVREFSCPNCRSKERFVESLLAEDRAAGKVKEGFMLASRVQRLEIVEPGKVLKAGDKVTVGFALYDYCLGCGMEYVFKMEKTEAEVVEKKNVAGPNIFLPPGVGPNLPGMGQLGNN